MKKRNICFFCSVASFDTGMPISTYKLVELFSQSSEWSPHVVLPERGDLYRRLEEKGASVAASPFHKLRSARHFKDFIRFILGLFPSIVWLARYIRTNHIEIIHFSDFIDCPFYPCVRWARIIGVAHLRLNIENRAVRFLYGVWSRMFIDRVVCISDSVKRYSGLSSEMAAVIYNPGPDLSLFDRSLSAPVPPGIDGGKIRVCCIANFRRVKGHESFVESAGLAESMLPGRMQFIIAGDVPKGHEGFYKKVMRLIRDKGLKDRFLLLGHVPHERVPSVLANTDLFVHLPHYQEGLGGVVLEAMAMGVPVVAFDSGGVGECFTDGVSGFLVRQFDCRAVAEKAVMLAKDAGMRKMIGERGRMELGKKFSYEKHFSQMEALYRSLIGD